MSINYSKRSVDKIPLNIKDLAVPHYSPEKLLLCAFRKKKKKIKIKKQQIFARGESITLNGSLHC